MRRFFGRKENGQVVLEGDEFNHLKNVLRLGVGAEILVSLGDENEYACEVESLEKRSAICKIIGKKVCAGNPKKNIVLFQAITKREKFEFIVQKATEIGVSKIVPFVSQHVVAKVTENKMDRLNAIAINACKQCERTIPPQICEPLAFDDVLKTFKDFDVVLFANERAEKSDKTKDLSKAKNIAIIVGSEGGFDAKEKDKFIAAGVTTISLGKRILRCETASVAMMSLVSILSEN